jgi:hypothetical protein
MACSPWRPLRFLLRQMRARPRPSAESRRGNAPALAEDGDPEVERRRGGPARAANVGGDAVADGHALGHAAGDLVSVDQQRQLGRLLGDKPKPEPPTRPRRFSTRSMAARSCRADRDGQARSQSCPPASLTAEGELPAQRLPRRAPTGLGTGRHYLADLMPVAAGACYPPNEIQERSAPSVASDIAPRTIFALSTRSGVRKPGTNWGARRE